MAPLLPYHASHLRQYLKCGGQHVLRRELARLVTGVVKKGAAAQDDQAPLDLHEINDNITQVDVGTIVGCMYINAHRYVVLYFYILKYIAIFSWIQRDVIYDFFLSTTTTKMMNPGADRFRLATPLCRHPRLPTNLRLQVEFLYPIPSATY